MTHDDDGSDGSDDGFDVGKLFDAFSFVEDGSDGPGDAFAWGKAGGKADGGSGKASGKAGGGSGKADGGKAQPFWPVQYWWQSGGKDDGKDGDEAGGKDDGKDDGKDGDKAGGKDGGKGRKGGIVPGVFDNEGRELHFEYMPGIYPGRNMPY